MKYLLFVNIAIFMAIPLTAPDECCPDEFKRYAVNHSFCLPPNPNCQIVNSSISSEDILIILRKNNYYRSRIAVGEELKLPSASNMLEMVWDDNLAAVAQKWTNQCELEHDCRDCRRVWNFEVGQRFFTEYVRNSSNVPEPDWLNVITKFYANDRKILAKKWFNPSKQHVPDSDEIYRRLSQMFWAGTWRIGCGYTLFTIENTYVKFYACNYGPVGMDNPGPMYKPGHTCSACPENAYCNEVLRVSREAVNYPGLCVIPNNEAPIYEPESSYIFYCNFRYQADCSVSTPVGLKGWLTCHTLTGNVMGVVLEGGEHSSITFTNTLKPRNDTMCLVMSYRKGPNVDGNEDINIFNVTFRTLEDGEVIDGGYSMFTSDSRHGFNKHKNHLVWDMETEMTLNFSVPAGKPAQFFEIKEIYAYDGDC